MTTNEALTQIFSTKKGFEKIGIPENTWNTIKKRFRDKRLLSDKIKDDIIKKAGFILVQDKQWELKSSSDGDQYHPK